MKKEEIYKDDELTVFLADGDRSESTKRKYRQRIATYCIFVDMKPSELLKEAIEDEKNPKLSESERKKKLLKKLLLYKEYLKNNKKLSQRSVSDYLTTIRSFYRFGQIELPQMRNGNRQVQKLETDEDIPDRETIRESLKHANKMYRAVITLMASSGMGASEIRSLKYNNFLFAVREYIRLDKGDEFNVNSIINQLKECENCIGVWKIVRIKNGNEYVTFSTPESIHYILDYLKERIRNNDPPKSLNEYLFRGKKHKKNPEREVKENAFMKYFQRLNETMQLGNNKTQPKYAFFTSHQLRRYFATTLDGIIPHDDIDKMEGHVKDRIDRAYFKTTVKKLKKSYLKGMEVLIINKPLLIDKTSEKVQELEEQMKTKDEEIKRIKEEKDKQIAKMSEKIERLEKLVTPLALRAKENAEEAERIFPELTKNYEEKLINFMAHTNISDLLKKHEKK